LLYTLHVTQTDSAKRSSKRPLAYGLERSRHVYSLRQARYKALAEAIASWIREQGPRHRPLRLVDLGMGRGRTLIYLEAEGINKEIEFHGLDISAKRLRWRRMRPEWNRCLGSLADPLPYASNAADICICEQVIEHLEDSSQVFPEIVRVLRPGGLLVLGVPIFPAPLAAVRRALVKLRRQRQPDGHFHLQTFTAASIRRDVERAGFRVLDQRGFRFVTGGPLARLEDRAWWYEANRRFGARYPSLCVETQIVAALD